MTLQTTAHHKPSIVLVCMENALITRILRVEKLHSMQLCKQDFAMQLVAKHIQGDERDWLLHDLDYAFDIADVLKCITNFRHFYRAIDSEIWINSLFVIGKGLAWGERLNLAKKIGIPTYLCEHPACLAPSILKSHADYTVQISRGIVVRSLRSEDL